MSGRFAPSPTGQLHLGNLRTAVVAWLSARRADRGFIVRMEDLDRHQARPEIAAQQLADMAALGLDWDGQVSWQSDRLGLYDEAIEDLTLRGLVYECYCSRREIALEIEESAHAPHGLPGAYPGTCRDLTAAARADRRAAGRRPALRLRTDGEYIGVTDGIHGYYEGVVDDVVLRRNDGVPAYNLAVVVDDGEQGITEVVRGDDLLPSTPRQILLQRHLGYDQPSYLHVPLVVGADGERLAKRHGAVTLDDLAAIGHDPADVVSWIGQSLRIAPPAEVLDLGTMLDRFDPAVVPIDVCMVPDLR